MTLPRSLRAQLTGAGFAAIYVAVLLLFGVSWLTEDETVDRVDGVAVTETSAGQGAGWVEVAVVALAPVAALLAWWWAGRAVRPIERIRSVAEHIEATDLSERIALRRGPTEVVSLAASFDTMLDRLHRAATSQRHVIDEVSHELRTPIAVLIANADVRLASTGVDLDWYRDGLEQSRRTAERMLLTLERLLADARNEARTLDRHPADLVDIVRGVVAEMTVVGARDQVTIDLTGPATLTGSWDGPTVARAVTNLVDNAIRHSPRGSAVDVRLHDHRDRVDITVSDYGPASRPRNSTRSSSAPGVLNLTTGTAKASAWRSPARSPRPTAAPSPHCRPTPPAPPPRSPSPSCAELEGQVAEPSGGASSTRWRCRSAVNTWMAFVSSVFVRSSCAPGREVVIGLGTLELGLAVLADHHERREEDGLERHDQRQPRPRVRLEEQHPAGEQRGVEVHELHRPREPGDVVHDAELDVTCSPRRMVEHHGVVERRRWRRPRSVRPEMVAVVRRCRPGHLASLPDAASLPAGITRAGAPDACTMSAAPDPNTRWGSG